MLKSDLIQRIMSENRHLYQRDVEKVVNTIFDEIVDALRRGDRVELRGLRAFSAKLRKARQGRNPRTGVAFSVPQRTMPSFRVGKEIRARLNPATAAVDPVAKEANLASEPQ